MNDYYSANVKCPYFVRIDRKTCNLTCESVLPGTTIKSHFDNGEDLKRAVAKYCCQNYQSCAWYRTIERKY